MYDLKLKVLTLEEFGFLKSKKPDGVYNRETREKLFQILAKLERQKGKNSWGEKKLQKTFHAANFGIHLDKNSTVRETIHHTGVVQVSGNFVGEIFAMAVLIEKTASVSAKIAAEVVMCKGKIFGEVMAGHKLKVTRGAKLKGYVHTPKFIIEKGAVFDGCCSMPNPKKFGLLSLLGEAFTKTG